MTEDATLSLYHVLRGHTSNISKVAWAPDGVLLASCSRDRSVRIWDSQTGKEIRILRGYTGAVHDLAWSPDGKLLATTTSNGMIKIWETGNWTETRTYQQRTDLTDIYSVTWSPNSQILVTGSLHGVKFYPLNSSEADRRVIYPSTVSHCVAWAPKGSKGSFIALGLDNKVTVLDLAHKNPRSLILQGHIRAVHSIEWSKNGETLVTGSADGTVRVWDVNNGKTLITLESHTKAVTSVCFSLNETVLASKSLDNTVRLWRCDTWENIKQIDEPSSPSFSRSSIAFSPKSDVLATLGEQDKSIRIWHVDLQRLFNDTPAISSVRYTNAKAVLLGDSGVGKSALGLVLRGYPFQPQDSTHGRHIWTLNTELVKLEDGIEEVREILLWDLAGQATYRLVHQLHLGEVNTALVVFDAKNQEDPFIGVRYWNRALEQVIPLQKRISFQKYLVAARIDVGGVPASRVRVSATANEMGFHAYFETSAKEGNGIAELKEQILASINWADMPRVASSLTFQQVRDFVSKLSRQDRVLLTFEDLLQAYSEHANVRIDYDGALEEFEAYIKRLETTGLIRRLSFGELILLQPELLDNYASSLINAAKEEVDDTGCIEEQRVQNGRFYLPANQRIKDRVQERLLLIATIADLLRHEIILREYVTGGSFLIFPSEFTHGNPDFIKPIEETIVFQFEGAVLNIYVTLIVRLWYSGIFKKSDFWRNAATYTTSFGGLYGLQLKTTGMTEGKGEIVLFFGGQTHDVTEYTFEEYVHDHLKQRATPNTVFRKRIYTCDKCRTPVSDIAVRKRIENGHKFILCNVCDATRIDLIDGLDRISNKKPSVKISDINLKVDARKDREIRVTDLQGEITHHQNLLETCQARLKVLEIKSAAFGFDTDAATLMEIDELKDKIRLHQNYIKINQDRITTYQQGVEPRADGDFTV